MRGLGGLLLTIFGWAFVGGLGDFLKNLGIGILVFAGINLVITNSLSVLQGYVNGFPSDLLQILELMGFSTGLSMIASALVTGVSIKVLMRRAKVGTLTA